MAQNYAGEVSVGDTWKQLGEQQDAVLIDVRTEAEWNYVGLPDLSALGKNVVRIEWQGWPDGQPNPRFLEEVRSAGISADQPTYLLCRSGVRSRAAAILLTQNGWQAAYNVTDGFEGPHDASRHRGTVGGWKSEGLPWLQG